MDKSQFNIKISKSLLTKIKRQAMMSGKTLTEHITDLITKSLTDNGLDNEEKFKTIKDFEIRLRALELIVSNLENLSQNYPPFNNFEAINCTKFMRGIFDFEVEKRNYDNKKEAFNDFLEHLNVFIKLSNFFTDRLKEVMLGDDPVPWTGEELNELSKNNKCNCPIRKALIFWTERTDCPSQQEICEKGEKLLPLLIK